MDDAWDMVWRYLASRGECDARGSVEYTRIRSQWELLGEWEMMLAYIRREANRQPPPPPVAPPPVV